MIWQEGDGDYCAILVAFNSILQMVLYAPFAIFYINIVRPHQPFSSDITVSYSIVAQSAAIFLGNRTSNRLLTHLGIPLTAAVITRLVL